MPMNPLVRLGNYISTKANFVKASIVLFGGPFGLGLALFLSEYGPVPVVIALLLAPVAGYLWGVAMWALVFNDIYARKRMSSEERQ